jgi:predicted SAM-dependent methyltransferase
MDREFPQEIAIRTMEFLTKLYEDLMNKELMNETVEKDREFREEMETIEAFKEVVESEDLDIE